MAYLPLSTANLPDPAIDPAQDVEPRDYFETFLYTGNGAGLQVGDVIKKPADTTTISSSLIFDGSTHYLSHTTSGTSSGQDQITVSFWIKNWKPDTSTFNHIWSALQGGSDMCFYMALTTTHTIRFYFDDAPSGSVGPTYFDTPMAFTDTSRWYHVHLKVDLNQSTTAEKYQVWVDGVQQTFSYTVQNGVQETNVDLFQNGTTHNIGRYIVNSSQHLGMYLAELHAVDGTAHDPTDFGNFDANGIWIPKTVTGIDYGTNGFYLDFSDNTSTTTLGEDQAGSNDWTLNNLATTDQVSDSPTDNFATLNPAIQQVGTGNTYSEGNLKIQNTSDSTQSTIKMTSGYWYAEATKNANGDNQIGVTSNRVDAGFGTNTFRRAWRDDNGSPKWLTDDGTAGSGTAESLAVNDVLGIAIDLENDAIYFSKNGTWMNSGDPTSGASKTGAIWTDLGLHNDWVFYVGSNANSANVTWNFGQRAFAETPPTGYLALSEDNITVDDQNLESPDFVWIKSRSDAYSSRIFDAVRGADKVLVSDTTAAEFDGGGATYLTSFNSNGFTLTSNISVNGSSKTYVAWCWKAPTSFSNGAGENGATIASSGKVSTESGFSIVDLTDPDTGASYEVKHGLGSPPEMFFIKKTNTTSDWSVYHKDVGNDKRLVLNDPGGQSGSSSVYFGSTTPTSSVVTIGSGLSTGDDWIMYCFHSVEGFSKFGSFSGNNSTDGPFIYLGFRPALFMVKCTNTTGSWYCYDTTRLDYNVMGSQGQPIAWDTTAGEDTGADASWYVDALSNGIKIRNNSGFDNGTNSFIYMAFAENPFKYSNAR